MQLAADIAVSLAAACGRFLVRRYLKEVADVPSDSLLDIAKRQLSDVRQQREVARVFEDFSDRMVAQIWSSLEGRLKTHPALDLNAVAREIAETLGRSISGDFVLRKQLEAAPLTVAFKATRSPSLAGLEQRAYEMMLDESLRYLVECSAALPRFELPQASECLKRLRTSGEDIDKALQTVRLIERQVIGSQGVKAATQEQRWEADYRQAVIRELDRVDLFGADLPAEAKRNLLTDAFVTLNINQKVKQRDVRADNFDSREQLGQSADAQPGFSPQTISQYDLVPGPKPRRVRIDESVDQEPSAENAEYIGLLSSKAVFDRLGLGEDGRLLIRGSAGMGKTTLMRWVAISAAKSDQLDRVSGVLVAETRRDGPHFEFYPNAQQRSAAQQFVKRFRAGATDSQTVAELFDVLGVGGGVPTDKRAELQLSNVCIKRVWKSQVPFLIPLRHCQSGRLPTPENLPLIIADIAKATGRPPAEWVEQVLKDGRALLLIDGVDEVPNQNRDAILEELQALIEAYPDNQFVVTTRPEAVAVDWLKDLHFEEARIAPLAESDVHKFIRLWHDAVEKELARRGQPAGGIREQGERLIEKLRNTPGLFFLAANPLLCAMICAMHHDRGQKLPEGQSELCESLTHMLLHRREREGGLEWQQFPAAYRDLTYPQKRRLAQELAVQMVVEEQSALSYELALKKIEHSLSGLGRTPADAAIVLTSLVERSGMLREPNPGSIDFIHNTFKEFLAGEAFGSGENVAFRSTKGRPFAEQKGTLAERVLGSDSVTAQESWRRIALFAAATKSSCANDLIEFALAGLDKIREHDAQTIRIVFAMQCERVANDAAAVIKTDTRDRLRGLATADHLRPQSFADADQLALLGDDAICFLERQQVTTHEMAEPVEQTAACVRALRLINTLAARQSIDTYLDHTELPVVLELCQIVNPLTLPAVRKLVQNTPFYERLPDGIRERISDLGPVATDPAWRNTTQLNFNGTPIRDVSPLAGLTSLQYLLLDSTGVSDVSPLAGLTKLRRLELNSTGVSDVIPLAGLTSLQYLLLNSTGVSDVSPLAGLTSLKRLELNSTGVSDVSPLAGLTSLQYLLLDSTGVSDVSPLAGLTKLQVLDLNSTGVSDVSPLAGLTELQISGLDKIQARATERSQSAEVSDRTVIDEQDTGEELLDDEQKRAVPTERRDTEVAWRIARIDIANFRGLGRREFKFRSEITVLIGNNATGKTSAIEAFSLTLGAFARGFDDATPRGFQPRDVHVTAATGELQFPVSVRATGQIDGDILDWIRVYEQADGQPFEREEVVAWSRAQRLQRQVRNGESVTLPVFAVFGSRRRIDVPELEPLETFPPGSRLQGYVQWQQPLEDLRPFMQWLKTRVLEAQQKGEPPADLLAVQAAVRSAFEKAVFPRSTGMPPVTAQTAETNSPPKDDAGGSGDSEDRQDASQTEMQLLSIDWDIRQNRAEALFSDGSRQRLGLLSDGQVGFLAIIAEIARRAATLNPHFGAEAAAKSPGIVLIDELDLHIHPRWQRTLIGDLKRTFPRMQFIIATHAALVVQSLQVGELINLDPDGEQNEDYETMSTEDILEFVMDVDGVQRGKRFNDLQAAAEEYYQAIDAAVGKSPEEIEILKHKLDSLSARFSNDPALHALLKLKRHAAGIPEAE